MQALGPQAIAQEQNKIMMYADLATTAAATSKALEGDALKSADFEAAVQDTSRMIVASDKTKEKKDIWNIYNDLLAIAGNKNTGLVDNQLFNETYQDNGVSYRRGNLAIELDGKVLNAVVDINEANRGELRVQLGTYKMDNGVLVQVPFTDSPVTVTRDGDMVVAKLEAMSSSIKQTMFGDPNYDLTVSQKMYAPMSHQLEPMLALAGLQKREDGPGYVGLEQSVVQSAQLVTAGTGTGKTAILAGYAKATNGGIISVPDDLVSQMVADAKDFIGTAPVTATAADLATPESLGKFLKENPYVVLSHDQVLEVSDKLKGQKLFIDEAHQLTLTKEGLPAPDKVAALKQVFDNNRSIAVTATPTAELYEMLGKEVADVSLNMAQVKLKKVRAVDTQDQVVGTAGQDNTEALVKATLMQVLGRETIMGPENKGYTSQFVLEKQGLSPEAAAARAAELNTIRSVDVQGMVFAKNPEVSTRVAEAINQIAAGTYPGLEELNKEISAARGGKPADLKAELAAAQQQQIADSINIEVLNGLNPKLKIKALQADARAGKDLESKREGLKAENLDQLIQKFTGLGEKEPELKPYYDTAIEVATRVSKGGELLKTGEVDLQKMGADSALLVPQSASKAEVDTGQQRLDRGLVTQFVSEGALGTGYSNTNILNTVMVETSAQAPGDAAIRMQQAGRPIRNDDRRAFAGTVVDSNVPEADRNPVTASIAVGAEGAKAAQVYREAVMKEVEILKGRETQAVAPVQAAQEASPPSPRGISDGLPPQKLAEMKPERTAGSGVGLGA